MEFFFLISPTELDAPIPLGILYFPLEDLILHFLRPVRLNHPYLIYNRIVFDTIGETSSVMIGCYFNPTEYYPTSDPLLMSSSWVIGVEPYDGHQYQL
ncbi:MAG: hypothetical protein FJX80_11970 [Bacteroidetes bacterium]|nr:hypothetical protein [Bacteroidota bacterium]